jgi:hypothetical protein
MPKSYDNITLGYQETKTYNYTDLPPDYYSNYYLSSTSSSFWPITTARNKRTFSGSTTPNHKSFLKEHGFLPTLYCEDEILKSRGIEVIQENRGYWDGRIANTVTTKTALSPWRPTEDLAVCDLAISKLRRKVLEQDVNVGVILAEARKTSDMVYNTARRIALAIRALRKGDLVRLSSLINVHPTLAKDLAKDLKFTKRDVHSYWLEMQYGWKPLLQDVEGMATAFAKTRTSRASILHAQSRSTIKYPTSPPSGSFSGLTGDVTHEGKSWITYRIRNDITVAANRLGLLNPLSVAWELVPFSFIADWFVNVGDYIEECSAFSGIDILDSGYSYRLTAKGRMCAGGDIIPRPLAETSNTLYKRFAGVPVTPKLMFKQNPFSKEHILNAVALLREVTKR